MIVKQTDNGEYVIEAQDGSRRQVAGPFPTHAAAWRWIDRLEGAPVSRSEATAISRESNLGAG